MSGDVYERTVEDKQVQIPADHAAKEVCIVAGGQALGYPQVESDGTVPIDKMDGLDVEVIVPSDEQFEDHA